MSQRVENLQRKQKQAHDNTVPQRSFSLGDQLFAENFSGTPPRWLPDTIVRVMGPLSYQVQLKTGSTVCRHVDSVHRRYALQSKGQLQEVDPLALPDTPALLPASPEASPSPQSGPSAPHPREQQLSTAIHQSTRQRLPPDHLRW